MTKIPAEFLEQVHDATTAANGVRDVTNAIRRNAPSEIIAEKIAQARAGVNVGKDLYAKEIPRMIDGRKTTVERLSKRTTSSDEDKSRG